MKHSVFFIILLLTFCLSAQNQLQDSLLKVIRTPAEDSNRVNALHILAGTYWGSDLEKAADYANRALEMSESLDYPTGIMKANYKLGVTAYYQGDFQKAEELAQTSMEQAKALKLYPFVESNTTVLGILYQEQGRLNEAAELFLKNIETQQKINDQIGLAFSYTNLANVYGKQLSNELAEKYTLKAIENFETSNHPDQNNYLAQAFVNLGIYSADDSVALTYFQKAIKLAEPENNQSVLGHSYSNMGSIYLKQKNYEQARVFLEKAQILAGEIGVSTLIAGVNNALAEVYIYFGQFNQAISLLEKTRTYSEEVGLINEQWEAAFALSNIYAKTREFEKAYPFLLETKELYDSLYSLKQLSLTTELDAKYERKQKEAELAQQELKITREKNLRNQIIMGAFILLLLAFSLFQWIIQRQKRRKRETELALSFQQKEADRLKELDKIKSNFFANISHEFRTPLTLIINPLKDLLDGNAPRTITGTYKLMLRNGERLLSLINQLLDLSKLEAGKLHLQARSTDINQWVRPVFHAFESLAERKQITYRLTTCPGSPTIWIDPEKMETVLNNLLSNAFKFTLEEGEIQVTITEENDLLQIKITDNGLGIPSENLPAIFDRFFQVETNQNQHYDGTGIGLSLVKELVDLHRGNISVSSQENQGTSFCIQLPLGATHLKPSEIIADTTRFAGQALESEKEMSFQNQIAPPTEGKELPLVLIAEDNEDIRQLIKNSLTGNYQVLESENGKIALELATQKVPDLVITDLKMPGMDGHELTQKLKTDASTSHIPIIMLTAMAGQDQKLQGLQIGADHFLTKPFDKNELAQTVDNIIRQGQLLKEKYSQSLLLNFNDQREISASPEEQFLQKIISVTEKNMEDEEFGVEDLSKAMHLSRFQLHRKMKALTNKSISVFIRTIRLQHAKIQLEQGKGNVSEIAFQLGFNSVAYFSKCFSDEFGYAPSKIKSTGI